MTGGGHASVRYIQATGITGGLPHQCELYYGITATGSDYDFDSLRGAPLVRNDNGFSA